MCTAVTYLTKDFYFGRNLDYEFSYGESVTVTPRRFPFSLARGGQLSEHFALIGMAHIANGYPLYYDAVNEKGLCAATLNFVGNAFYPNGMPEKTNIAQFEFIPYILGKCADIGDVRNVLSGICICSAPFAENMPPSPLHWIFADRHECITVESTHSGLQVFDNPVGVLTNNPPFPQQLFALNNFMQLSPKAPEPRFSAGLEWNIYSRGMGAIGLPGDLSSQSRFVRTAFVKMNSVSKNDEKSSVSQFFHILTAAEQTRGCCELGDGKYEITLYSSCCNADKGIYYYTTYENRRICAVDMHRTDLEGEVLLSFPLKEEQDILYLTGAQPPQPPARRHSSRLD